MKKIFLSIVLLFCSMLCFSEQLLNGNIFCSGMFGKSKHNSVDYESYSLGLGIGLDYSYIFQNGFSINPTASVLFAIGESTRYINDLGGGFIAGGGGYNLGLGAGYTSIHKNIFQIILYPVYLQKLFIDDDDAVLLLNKKSYSDTDYSVNTEMTNYMTNLKLLYLLRDKDDNGGFGITSNIGYAWKEVLYGDSYSHDGFYFSLGLSMGQQF